MRSLVAVALALGVHGPVSAQCRLCSTPTTQIESEEAGQAIRLEANAVLDFDRLVLLGDGNGAATLLPNGDRSASGIVATVSARAMVGSVSVHGEPGRALRIEMPARIKLYSISGGAIAVDDIGTDLPSLPRLDSAGNLSFRFGGRLTISGNADGEYRGDIPINVEYL